MPDTAFSGLKVLKVSCEDLYVDGLGERYPGWRNACRRGETDRGVRIVVGQMREWLRSLWCGCGTNIANVEFDIG